MPPALQDDLPLHEDFPLLAGAAAPPAPPLHELLPPDADGSVAPLPPALPPPQATMEPIIIPATADTARAFAMFMTVVSSTLIERLVYPAIPRRLGETYAPRLSKVSWSRPFFWG